MSHKYFYYPAANEPKFFCELQGRHNDEAWESPGFDTAMERFLDAVQHPQNTVPAK